MAELYYGAVDQAHIVKEAKAVCDALGKGKNGRAFELLLETAAAETQLGTYPDNFAANGHGLCQIDQISFNDIKTRTRERHKQKIEFYFGIQLDDIKISHIQTGPRWAFIFARLHYILKPEPIPATLKGRADYWKKHYNTVAGKGTPEHYIESAHKHLYAQED